MLSDYNMNCWNCGKNVCIFWGKKRSLFDYEDSFGDKLYICLTCEQKYFQESICKFCNKKVKLPYNNDSYRYVIFPSIDKNELQIVKICDCSKKQDL